jgi:hypothetical protein
VHAGSRPRAYITHQCAPLWRVLTPRGARLSGLLEAGQYLSESFAAVTHSAVLEHAIVLLMRAAESGKAKDRKAATDQLAILTSVHGRRRKEEGVVARGRAQARRGARPQSRPS